MNETYRRCCTSVAYAGIALAARLMHAEKIWNYDAFFAYVDRWMYEDDPDVEIFQEMTTAFKVHGWGSGLYKEGDILEKWVGDMWAKYRYSPGMPPSGYKVIPPVTEGNVQVGPGGRGFVVDGKALLPIMLMDQSPEQIDWAKSVGINTFMGNGWRTPDGMGQTKSPEFLAKLADAGMYGVFGPDARLCGQKNLLGWLQYDQPDAVKMQPVADVQLDAAHQPDRTYVLARLVDGVTANRQAMASPMLGAEITIRLTEPVTASSLAIWSEKGTPEDPRDVEFLLDGKPAAKGRLQDRSGQQKFPLPAPVSFKTLTVKVISVYETENKNKWGSMEEIQALDQEGKPLPLYTPSYVAAVPAAATGELYQWFKRMDASRPVFMDLGAFVLKPPQGWEGDARAKLYGGYVQQADAVGVEIRADPAAAVADLAKVAAQAGARVHRPGRKRPYCQRPAWPGPGRHPRRRQRGGLPPAGPQARRPARGTPIRAQETQRGNHARRPADSGGCGAGGAPQDSAAIAPHGMRLAHLAGA